MKAAIIVEYAPLTENGRMNRLAGIRNTSPLGLGFDGEYVTKRMFGAKT
jgi:hypothetical protein